MNEEKGQFYKRCEAIANSKNLSFYKIAKEINVTGATITGWKKGSLPKADIAVKIAKILDVSVEYLVTGKESNYELTPDEIDVLHIYRTIQAPLHETVINQLIALASIQTPLAVDIPPAKND